MFRFLCKKIAPITKNGGSTIKLGFLSNPSLSYIVSSTNQPSFTVSYLKDSCGLSEEAAISASKRICLKTSEKPGTVLTFFRNCGFNETQISKIIKKRPLLLLARPEKSFKPKLDFLNSIGFSPSEVADIITEDPSLLRWSLKNSIIPCVDFLKSFLRSNVGIIASIKRSTRVIQPNHQKIMICNIEILRDSGLPESRMRMLVTNQPIALLQNPIKFIEIIKNIEELGFDPLKFTFAQAIIVMTSVSKSTWEAKLKVYKSWGWSEEEIVSAFKKQPLCMGLSEEKITKAMDFLVKKMGFESCVIARMPAVLFFSLKNRIIPRCLVVKVLQSKGLINKSLMLSSFLVPNDKYFLKTYVTKYEKKVPQLSKLYHGKRDFQTLRFGTNQKNFKVWL